MRSTRVTQRPESKAVEAWLKATSEEATMRVVGDLKAEVTRLKGGLRGKPPLRSA